MNLNEWLLWLVGLLIDDTVDLGPEIDPNG
jgi:hypothetical protein